MNVNITFSPRFSLSSASNQSDATSFLSSVNESLAAFHPSADIPPPEIPEELKYQTPLKKLKDMSTEIGRMLDEEKESKLIDEDELICSLYHTDFDYSSDLTEFFNEIDYTRSFWSYIERRCPNIKLPNKDLIANEMIYNIFVVVPFSNQLRNRIKISQWILALGSNTLQEFVDSIICPLCKIALEVVGPHKTPSELQIGNKKYFKFDDGFNKTLGSINLPINSMIRYKSEGGCSHIIIIASAIAVNATDPTGFPVDIGGKGSKPPLCEICGQRPGHLCSYLENVFHFYCNKCYEEDHLELPIIDLKNNFFSYIT